MDEKKPGWGSCGEYMDDPPFREMTPQEIVERFLHSQPERGEVE